MAKGKKISISPYIFFKGIILFTILAKLKSHPYGNRP